MDHFAMRARMLIEANKAAFKELGKLKKSVEQKGTSIIPYRLFINDKGLRIVEGPHKGYYDLQIVY